MTEQPSMAHLEVSHPGPEFDILLTQEALQKRIHNEMRKPYQPVAVTEEAFLESFRMNTEAMDAEWQEIFDRLPWKEWKADHRRRIADREHLSDDARLEIKYELVDALHFLLNLMIRAGFDSWHEVESFYWAKNRENHDRQERGY